MEIHGTLKNLPETGFTKIGLFIPDPGAFLWNRIQKKGGSAIETIAVSASCQQKIEDHGPDEKPTDPALHSGNKTFQSPEPDPDARPPHFFVSQTG